METTTNHNRARVAVLARLVVTVAAMATGTAATSSPAHALEPCHGDTVTVPADQPTGCDLTAGQTLHLVVINLADCDNAGGRYYPDPANLVDVCADVDY